MNIDGGNHEMEKKGETFDREAREIGERRERNTQNEEREGEIKLKTLKWREF